MSYNKKWQPSGDHESSKGASAMNLFGLKYVIFSCGGNELATIQKKTENYNAPNGEFVKRMGNWLVN